MLDACGEVAVSATLSTTIPLVDPVAFGGIERALVTTVGGHVGLPVTSIDIRQPSGVGSASTAGGYRVDGVGVVSDAEENPILGAAGCVGVVDFGYRRARQRPSDADQAREGSTDAGQDSGAIEAELIDGRSAINIAGILPADVHVAR